MMSGKTTLSGKPMRQDGMFPFSNMDLIGGGPTVTSPLPPLFEIRPQSPTSLACTLHAVPTKFQRRRPALLTDFDPDFADQRLHGEGDVSRGGLCIAQAKHLLTGLRSLRQRRLFPQLDHCRGRSRRSNVVCMRVCQPVCHVLLLFFRDLRRVRHPW